MAVTNTGKRDRILEAALQLFLERGIDATSTSSISAKAGVSTGLLFHHFGSKTILVRTLYQGIAAEAMSVPVNSKGGAIDEELTTFERGIRQAVDSYVDWALDNWNKFLFLRLMDAHPDFEAEDIVDRPGRSDFRPVLEERAANAAKNGQLKPYLFTFALELSVNMMAAMAEFFHNHPSLRNDSETRDQVWSFYWDALRVT